MRQAKKIKATTVPLEPEAAGITTQEYGSTPPFTADSVPDDVWALILSRMLIRDAVRTSILSKAWRRRWRITSALIFDESTIPRRLEGNDSPSPYYSQLAARYLPARQGRSVNQWLMQNSEALKWLVAADILRRVMLQHESSILTFRLSIRLDDALPVREALRAWVEKCHETVEELVLDGCALHIPAGLYAGSAGFPKLTSLTLKGVVITADDLGSLISSCPLLSQLTLDMEDLKCAPTGTEMSYPTLVMSAARLKHLEMRLGGLIWCIRLIAPQLVSAWVSLAMFNGVHIHYPLPHGCNLIHLLGESPRLEKLTITSMSLQFLCVDKIPNSLRQPLSQLQRLDLKINFQSPFHALGALCLFKSSPILMRLRIDCWPSGSRITIPSPYPEEAANIWAAAEENSCCFPRLRHMVISQLNGIDSEVAFLRFVLQQAPVLAELDIKARSGIDEITGPLEGLKDLLALRRGMIPVTVHCCRSHVYMP